MATGDAAAAAGMSLVGGSTAANTIDTEINKTRDYIAQRTNAVQPVSKGGTGATTASAARTNLGALGESDVSTGPSDLAGKIPRYDSNGRFSIAAPSASSGVANKAYVDAVAADMVGKSGPQTMSGNLFLPNATLASSSYVVCYLNGDGRVSRGASSERYKKFISDIDPLSLGDLFPPFRRFQLRGGDGVWRYGYTAEQLAADPATEPFAIYQRHIEDDGTAPHLERDEDGAPIPESIDFIGLLLAQNAQLNARLARLEGDQT